MALKTATKTDTNRVELIVEVDADSFEAAVSKAYKKNIGKMNIPGFRKGKAPRSFVEKIYGSGVFYEDAVNALYPEALDAAIKESGYEYVEDKIDLDVESVGKEGLVFKAVITVKPEVEVGEYKGLKATKKLAPVTDEDLDAELKKVQERNSRLVSVENHPAENGDTVTFDFEGFVDGEPFEGGKAENYTLVLGSNQFIPGFEEQLVGKSIDEEIDVNVTFPEDYHAAELAGKPAVFKCKIHEVQVKELPELNDDLAKDTSEFDTLEELKADIKGKLEHERTHAAEDAVENQLLVSSWRALRQKSRTRCTTIVSTRASAILITGLQSQGLNLQTYMQYTGMDMDAFRAGFREQAEKQVKIRLALEKIASLENIAPSDEELEAEYAKYAEQYKMDVEKIKSLIPSAELSKDLAVGKAMEMIKETAVITEE